MGWHQFAYQDNAEPVPHRRITGRRLLLSAAVQAFREIVNDTRLIGLIHKGSHRILPSKSAEYSKRRRINLSSCYEGKFISILVIGGDVSAYALVATKARFSAV